MNLKKLLYLKKNQVGNGSYISKETSSFWDTHGKEVLRYTGGIFFGVLVFFLIYRFRSKWAQGWVSCQNYFKSFVMALALAALTGFLFKVPKLAAYRTYEVEVLRNQDFFDVSHYFVFNYTYAIGVLVVAWIVLFQVFNRNNAKKDS